MDSVVDTKLCSSVQDLKRVGRQGRIIGCARVFHVLYPPVRPISYMLCTKSELLSDMI